MSSEYALKGGGAALPTDTKPKPPVSLWVKNIQLASVSLFIALWPFLYRAAFGDGGTGVLPDGDSGSIFDRLSVNCFFYGFSFWAWAVAVNNSGGGLLV